MLALSYWVFLLGFANIPFIKVYNRLGDYSYGFYIYAFPSQQIASMLGFTTLLTHIVAATSLTLVLAILSWHLIERPSLKLKVKRG